MEKDTDIVANQNSELEKQETEQSTELVSDEAILGIYSEILGHIRKNKDQTQELLDNFAEMVFNEGDASNSSKEALVSLVKARSDESDKMIKIADLMTRIKLKERNTMTDWQKSKHNNTINIIDNGTVDRKGILESMGKSKSKASKKTNKKEE